MFDPTKKDCWIDYMQRNDSIGMSKRSYMDAVLEGLRDLSSVDVDLMPYNTNGTDIVNVLPKNDGCNGSTRKKVYVRLLLSIDRRETTAAAMETVCSDTCMLNSLITVASL